MATVHIYYFNSIKVRLEREITDLKLVSISFQFHKGTIRTRLTAFVNKDSAIFQFHKGTIRTRGL